MNTPVYKLCNSKNNSDLFYKKLELVTDEVISKADNVFGDIVSDFGWFIEMGQVEKLRTREEYYIEAIMIGTLWQKYIEYAHGTSKPVKILLGKLYLARTKFTNLKPVIDSIRGFLSTIFLTRKSYLHDFSFSIENYKSLVEWLSATSEFNEEVKRLKNWHLFFLTRNDNETRKILTIMSEFAVWFEMKCKQFLGDYTKVVNHFVENDHAKYRFREDYFFTGRQEPEYYLNMVGAEIINREQRSRFEKASRKAVLLPTCMRNIPEGGCKADFSKKDIVCTHCNKSCNVNKITTEMENKGVEVYMVPHTSDFTKFLDRWKSEPNVALVGVACVLNLLTGGYEMKDLNIASQCVFLDFPGCKKHWNKNGLPTQLNINQLHSVIAASGDQQNTILGNTKIVRRNGKPRIDFSKEFDLN